MTHSAISRRHAGVRLLAVFCLISPWSASQAQSVAPLVHEGTINAPVEKVWDAWATSEGLRSWLAPHAEIDFRIAGLMRANYNPDGTLGDGQTIENTILSYDPQKMISIRVSKAPDDFPFPGAIFDMWTIIYFDSDGPERTKVRIVANGFSTGEESQAMRAFFDQGNEITLREMQERIGEAAP